VNGVLTADPRVVKSARTVSRLSYGEAAELTHFGAKVLHPKTVQPAVAHGIPVRVRNSRAPEHPGTLVNDEPEVCHARPVKAIAHRTGGVSIKVSSDSLRGGRATLEAILEVFERHAAPVDLVSTTEAGVSLTIGGEGIKLDPIVRELRRLCPVEVRENLAFVCLVGEGLRHAPGVAAKVARALGEEDALADSRRAAGNNLTLVVRAERIGDVVTRLHREFFESEHASALFDAALENAHAPAHT
jgi:aspartate kinase